MSLAQSLATIPDLVHEQIQVDVLVLQRLLRRTAALADLLRELNHLVDRLATGQPADILLHERGQIPLGLTSAEVDQRLHHHRNHHVEPAARIRDRVPSKSKSTTRAFAALAAGLRISNALDGNSQSGRLCLDARLKRQSGRGDSSEQGALVGTRGNSVCRYPTGFGRLTRIASGT